MPDGYYAMSEQRAGPFIADVVALRAPTAPAVARGGVAVAEAPPRVRRKITLSSRRRSVAIHHASDDRVVAVIEIVSPGSKDRVEHVEEFARKGERVLAAGVHLLVVDLFAAGTHDPRGLHAAICERFEGEVFEEEPREIPAAEYMSLASFVSGRKVVVYVENLGLGSALPDMPVFLDPEFYVNAPLDPAYQAAYRGMSERWRAVLEARGV